MGPTFVIIGGQRCGTSWTRECLAEHPEVFVPADRGRWLSDEGLWDECRGQQARGLVLANLMSVPGGPGELLEANPNVHWVMLLRDPVARAHSWYLNLLRRGDGIYAKKISFEQAIEQDTSIIDGGMYYTHLQRFAEVLPWENFVPMLYDQMKHDPEAYLARLFSALGVDPQFKPSLLGKRVAYIAKNRSDRIHQFARMAKRTLTRLAGRNVRLVNWLERTRLVAFARSLNEAKPSAMREDTRRRLLELYTPEIEGLERLLRWDLTNWKQVEPAVGV